MHAVYAFGLMVRTDDFTLFQGLFNQYCVGMMAKMISESLNFIKRNQKKKIEGSRIHSFKRFRD